MPKEKRVVPMGVITAGSSRSAGAKLKFATTTPVLGKSAPQGYKEKKKKASTKDAAGAKAGGGQSGMVFNKGFGQHILKNPLVIAAIVEKSAIKATDVVMEIGPGTGNLTEKLLQTAKKVIAFEIDPRMVAELNKRFQGTPLAAKLQIVRGDCLQQAFPYFDKCVANVPYAISSALVFKLLDKPTFKCAVLMFQREFALRVCAQPGSEAYCRLSVNAQLLARCSHLMKISKNSFNPPPKVESSVIRLDPKYPAPDVDFEEWDGMIRLIFNRKNKKVASIFRTRTTQQTLLEHYNSYRRMNHQGEGELNAEQFKELMDSVLRTESPDTPGQSIFDQRGRSMNEQLFMDMLAVFHRHGIHFV